MRGVDVAPVRGELRYWLELARLLGGSAVPLGGAGGWTRLRSSLIPGFMAGDASLTALAGWLRRRGHDVRASGMLVNVGCAGRELYAPRGEARRDAIGPGRSSSARAAAAHPGARPGRRAIHRQSRGW